MFHTQKTGRYDGDSLKSYYEQESATAHLKRPEDQSWEKRAIAVLNTGDSILNGWMPNWILQTKIDALGNYIESKFSCFNELNVWLRGNGEGVWYSQLAVYLAKLPIRSAHNVVNILYGILSDILKAAVHPLKGFNRLVKQIVLLIHALTQPGTYCKIGSGVIGAGVGKALILGTPVIGMTIGSALLASGLSIGALEAAVRAEEGKKGQAAMGFLRDQFIQIPESALTGLYMGLLIGGIRKAMKKGTLLASHGVTNLEEARAYAATFVEQNHLPSGYWVKLDSGTITISWPLDLVEDLPIPPEQGCILAGVDFIIPASGKGYALVDWYEPMWGDDNHMMYQYSLESLGLKL